MTNKTPPREPAIFNMHFEATTKIFQVVKLEDYNSLQAELDEVKSKLERAESLLRRCGKYLDENVAFTGCEGSVYEFDDDQFGMLMFYRDEIDDYFAEAEK